MGVTAGQGHHNITDRTSQFICYTLKRNNEGKEQRRQAGVAGQMEITSCDCVASAFSFPEVRARQG